MITYVPELLTVLLATAAIAILHVRNLFALVVLLSVYSGLLASLFSMLGAPDVAFTEAVVGTSVSTIFLMALMWWIDPMELSRYPPTRRLLAWIPAAALGAVLLFGVDALPVFGEASAPSMLHVSPEYVARSVEDMHTPNVVTAVLADYRGFDTLIETAVVLTAAVACLLVLQRRDDRSV